MERRTLIVASLVVVGIAVVGFVRGLSPADATFETGVQPWTEAAHRDGEQPSYAQLRDGTTAEDPEGVARTCAD